jgi:4-amino-4-deoxy-L-arabinose transferase-like glycosyltransferase
LIAGPLSRARALALLGLIWAAIYLPALGTLEIKGEEGRRILPGVTMLETGHWIVPSVGGADYFSKPPLVNWAIAAAIHVSGRQDEWAARAPSALSVLALGGGTVWLLADWLGSGGALLAAIFMLTGIGMMEKGRLAEIEGMYISLSGLALVSWLALWRRTLLAPGDGRLVWLAWTVPWVFVGLGLLTKGPLHLVFFYAVVLGVLLAARRTGELWRWPHLAGVGLMLAIFAAWAVPYLHLAAPGRVGHVWTGQMANRFEIDEGFHPGSWALNIPRGLVNFVPWVVLLPMLWRRVPPGAAGDLAVATDMAILRGGRWALAACFLGVSLAPGGQPRYTLPLLVPASVLLALVCTRESEFGAMPKWLPVVWSRVVIVCLLIAGTAAGVAARFGVGGWRWLWASVLIAAGAWFIIQTWRLSMAGKSASPLLGVLSAAAMAMLTLDYAMGAVPRLLSKERLRPTAFRLNGLVFPAGPVYAYQPGFLPIFFYLHPSAHYFRNVKDLPDSAKYVLASEKDEPLVEKPLRARGFTVQRAVTLEQPSRGTWCLLRLEPEASLPGGHRRL